MTAFIYIPLALVLCDLGSTRRADDLLRAIRTVESHGKHAAVGDGGRAIGPYQIHYAYWKDSGVPGRWEQCRERRYAERVVLAYWRRYFPKALASGDWKTLARAHNGGPRGHMNPRTFGYWQKIHSIMRSEKKGSAISCLYNCRRLERALVAGCGFFIHDPLPHSRSAGDCNHADPRAFPVVIGWPDGSLAAAGDAIWLGHRLGGVARVL